MQFCDLYPGIDPRSLDPANPEDADFVYRALAIAALRQRIRDANRKG